jgi:RND family efflux transporter MFP subunit
VGVSCSQSYQWLNEPPKRADFCHLYFHFDDCILEPIEAQRAFQIEVLMSRPEELLSQLKIERSAGKRNKRKKWPWVLAIIALLAAGLVVMSRMRPVTVDTATARSVKDSGPVSLLDASGFVVARRIATVSAKVTGKVKEVLIEEGQRVEAGQVLATLDSSDSEAALDTARTQLISAESQLAEARANLTLAQQNLSRNQDLAKRQLIAKAVLDQSLADRDARAARLNSLRSSVEVARAQLRQSEVNSDNTVVRAPFSGVIVTKAAQPGEMISPISGGGGSIRTGIGTLVDMDSLEIDVDVNEAFIGRVQSKMPVDAVLNAYPDWKIPGEVIAIIPTADRTKATVKVRIALNVKDARIVPDMGVRVSFLETRDPSASKLQGVWVPANAVQSGEGGAYVLVFENGKAKRVSVSAADKRDADQLITSGLNGGEVIITGPLNRVRDGSAVALKPAPGAAANSR